MCYRKLFYSNFVIGIRHSCGGSSYEVIRDTSRRAAAAGVEYATNYPG